MTGQWELCHFAAGSSQLIAGATARFDGNSLVLVGLAFERRVEDPSLVGVGAGTVVAYSPISDVFAVGSAQAQYLRCDDAEGTREVALRRSSFADLRRFDLRVLSDGLISAVSECSVLVLDVGARSLWELHHGDIGSSVDWRSDGLTLSFSVALPWRNRQLELRWCSGLTDTES